MLVSQHQKKKENIFINCIFIALKQQQQRRKKHRIV